MNAGAYDGAVSKRTRGTYCTESVSAVWTAPSPHYVKQSLGKSSFFLDCAKKQGPSRVKVKVGAYDGDVSKRTRGTYCVESVSAVWAAPSLHYVKQSLGKSCFFQSCVENREKTVATQGES